MRTGFLIALAAAGLCVWAGTPRATPEDYPAHADSLHASIGADYLVHSVPTDTGMLFAGHYLVIEVGIFPHKTEEVPLASLQFHLFVNGRQIDDPDSAGSVAANIKFPDAAGIGPGVIGPQSQAPVEAPSAPGDGSGTQKEPLTIDEVVARTALPSGPVNKVAGGCVFFPYDGRTAKIRTLELVWEAPNGPAVHLKLR